MSQRAILLATRNYLRSNVPTSLSSLFNSTTINQCIEVTFDGRPLPHHGEAFIAVHPGTWSNQYDEGIEEEFGVNLTVSVKGGKTPLDRWGPELMENASTGLDKVLEVVRVMVHSNYTIMTAANTIITASANGFIRPLYFRDGGTPQPKGGSWWSARGKEEFGGLAQTLRFAGAMRDQTIESMT